MNQAPFPARLHVLLAREAPYGVVIRRGPTRHTRFIGWNRADDTFEPTQWLRGRVYGRRSDISPDGKYLIYFALNGKWKGEALGSWTAISRSPWMKAIALYAKGNCWHGGGLFLDNRTYWLNDGYGHQVLLQSEAVVRDEEYEPEEDYGGEDLDVYYVRLQRDGWQFKCNADNCKKAIFEKALPQGWILRKLAHADTYYLPGKGCYWDEHQLIRSDQKVFDHPDWEWAELDGRRLVWTTQGRLWACSIISATELGPEKQLYDFNDMQFEPIKAPY
ncbi:MAG: hypothetical protein JW709_04300 [Sedimentisphaerales bacterium]|nr:hypothetical protein [Sedimentisphaerales bacterium]